jgi:hypothetical protein
MPGPGTGPRPGGWETLLYSILLYGPVHTEYFYTTHDSTFYNYEQLLHETIANEHSVFNKTNFSDAPTIFSNWHKT